MLTRIRPGGADIEGEGVAGGLESAVQEPSHTTRHKPAGPPLVFRQLEEVCSMPLGHDEVGGRRGRGWISDAVRSSGLSDQMPTRVWRAKRTGHRSGTLAPVDMAVSVDLAVVVAKNGGIWQDNVALVHSAPVPGVGPETTSLYVPPHREVRAPLGFQQLGYGHQHVGLLLRQQHIQNVVTDNRVVPSSGFRRMVVGIETHGVNPPGAQEGYICPGSAPEVSGQSGAPCQAAGGWGKMAQLALWQSGGCSHCRASGRLTRVATVGSSLRVEAHGGKRLRLSASAEHVPCVGFPRRGNLRFPPFAAALGRGDLDSLCNAAENVLLPAHS